MNNRTIIYATVAFIFASLVFLSALEEYKSDIDRQNVWMLYFTDAKSDSLDFAVENHSENKDFHWEIYYGKTKAKEGDLAAEKGEIKKIPVSSEAIEDKKITITVTSGENKKEIYKNL